MSARGIRPLGAYVAIEPWTSKEQAEFEERINGGMAFPEVVTDPRRARLRVGTLIASGPGKCDGACVEQADPLTLPLGATVLYEFSGGFEHRINDREVHLVQSKMLLARFGPLFTGFAALGWYALVREMAEEFEEHKHGPSALPRAELGSDSDLKGDIRKLKLRLFGGRILSVGRGTYIPHRPHSPEVVRSWDGFEVGDRLAFNAQTATMLYIGGKRHYFASCAADIAGAGCYVW